MNTYPPPQTSPSNNFALWALLAVIGAYVTENSYHHHGHFIPYGAVTLLYVLIAARKAL